MFPKKKIKKKREKMKKKGEKIDFINLFLDEIFF